MTVSNFDTDDPTLTGRYLADQLTDAEREAFEAELVRNPARLQELEATARLKVGLRYLRRSGELDTLSRTPPRYRNPAWLALAAALALFVVGALLFRVNVAPRNATPLLAAAASSLVDRQGNALHVTTTKALFRKRVGGDDAVIEQGASSQAVELRILPQTQAQPARYRLSISRLRNGDVDAPIATVENLQPMEDGFVNVFADASQLEPGRYRLVMSGEAPGAAADSFVIRVVSAPAH